MLYSPPKLLIGMTAAANTQPVSLFPPAPGTLRIWKTFCRGGKGRGGLERVVLCKTHGVSTLL